jgi:hypothetical protein
MDKIFKVPDGVNYISFRTGVKVGQQKDLGVTTDGRLLTLELDKSGRILGLLLL